MEEIHMSNDRNMEVSTAAESAIDVSAPSPAQARGQVRPPLRQWRGAGLLSLPRVLQPVRRLGPAGAVGGGLGLLGLVILLVAALPSSREAASLEAQLSLLPLDPARASVVAHTRTPQSFLAGLPSRAELPAILATFVAQAEAAQIELHDGHYELSAPTGGGAGRYQMTLPVHGTYPNVRKFVDGSLAAVPAAALDSISLRREDISNAAVDADLKFVVFVRGGR
jgi:hypothetical protein